MTSVGSESSSSAAASRPTPLARPVRLLVVTEDGGPSPLLEVSAWAAATGVECEVAADLPRAVRLLATAPWDAVAIAPGENAERELGWWRDALRTAQGHPRLIVFADRPSMGLVFHAERLGALEVLPLPPERAPFLRAVDRLHVAATEVAVELPRPDGTSATALVGQSPAMLEVYRLLAPLATSVATVLLQGESGTGKEVVARTIHEHGPRAQGPFVAVNCAAIPENLLESELFGHEKGAFTGAVARRIGRVEQAVGGTLFLDEIVDMSLPLQAKILRVLQEREIERVGGTETIPVDVRIIAASNRDLRAAISAGHFREDLYYRIAVVPIRLPRLTERGDDLLLLIGHFVHHFAERAGKTIHWISDRALEVLQRHEWVGNVRELRNVIERAVVVSNDDTIRLEHLPDELGGDRPSLAAHGAGVPLSLAEAEARHISRVLAQAGGQIGVAAVHLGIHRNTLARKIKEYGL